MFDESPAADVALRRARRLIPTGHTSAARLGVEPHPLFIASADGCRLRDVDGNEIIDFQLANGPLLMGHRPQVVLDAVEHQLRQGLVYGAQHRLEAEVAEGLAALVPSAERVQFCTTGSEAVHAALRIARAATGRPLVLRFEGHYHGWFSDIAFNGPGSSVGDEAAELPLRHQPMTGGIPPGTDVLVGRWNDPEGLIELIRRFGGELAAVICEPVPLAGLIEPEDGFLELLRSQTRECGAALIFDEVVSGFRIRAGGAQELYGVTPDLTVLAKALGAGWPVSAVVGAAGLLDLVDEGIVAHMGTFNGYPPALAAADAALDEYADPLFAESLNTKAARLAEGLREAAADTGTELRVHQIGAIVSTAFIGADKDVRNPADLAHADQERAHVFSAGLLTRGVFVPPRNIWMLCSEHYTNDIDQALEAASAALADIADRAAT